MSEHALPPVALHVRERYLRIRYHSTLEWVVVDKTGLGPFAQNPPVLFASRCVDHCRAWLARQRYGAPRAALTMHHAPEYRTWYLMDGEAIYASAKTKALARDCIRIITTNPAPLEGVWF